MDYHLLNIGFLMFRCYSSPEVICVVSLCSTYRFLVLCCLKRTNSKIKLNKTLTKTVNQSI
jgi:hypothetical protein